MPVAMTSLNGFVHVADDADALFEALGDTVVSAAARAVEARGAFQLALSGGSTPEPFYIRLVTDPKFRTLPWADTHVWQVDERRVPDDDEKRNWKMLRESLLDHAGIPKANLHPMPVMEDDPAGLYEAQLCKHMTCDGKAADTDESTNGTLREDLPRLDLVLLGMGDDAHTASLFPRSDALRVREKLVAVNDGEGVTPPARLTLTYPLLNAAREIAVLVMGENKHAALKKVAAQAAMGIDTQTLPITGIDPESCGGGDMTWFLDKAAAQGPAAEPE
jgi:6-phosphogluconolactonase